MGQVKRHKIAEKRQHTLAVREEARKYLPDLLELELKRFEGVKNNASLGKGRIPVSEYVMGMGIAENDAFKTSRVLDRLPKIEEILASKKIFAAYLKAKHHIHLDAETLEAAYRNSKRQYQELLPLLADITKQDADRASRVVQARELRHEREAREAQEMAEARDKLAFLERLENEHCERERQR